jgi:uncharacterized protein (DUF305 family)
VRRAAGAFVACLVAVGGLAACTFESGGDRGTETPTSTADASTPPTLVASDADIGFLQDMADHHAQAVQLSAHAARRATDDAVRGLAFEILASQSEERGRIAALLGDRGSGPGDPDRDAMAWMGEPTPVGEMPGMLAADELAAVLAAEGTALDRAFLEAMQAHHEGGIEMASHGQDHAGDPRIRALAGAMVVTQEQELADLVLLLGSSG